MDYTTLAFRFLLAGVFLFAGLSKVTRIADFESAVRRYGVLPERAVRAVALALPPFELVCGLLLAVGIEIRVVSVLLAATLCVFAGAVGFNLLRGRVIECGCFSAVAPTRISWSSVARNVVLAGAAVVVAAKGLDSLALEHVAGATRSTVSNADAAAVLIVSACCLAAVSLFATAFSFRRASNTFGRQT